MEGMILPIYGIALVFAVVAFLYASVGLGGGSSYTALLAVLGATTAVIPMISLSLNVIVTTLGGTIFLARRHLRPRLIGPFLVSSIPMAYIGGMLDVSRIFFHWLLLTSLIVAALKIYLPRAERSGEKSLVAGERSRLVLALCCGGILGLVAGIVGIGGGIYLVPLILLLGLGSTKEAAACGAIFVWINSVIGLISRYVHQPLDPLPYLPLIAGVIIGGIAGATLGAGSLPPRSMEKVLGIILMVAIGFLGRKIYLMH